MCVCLHSGDSHLCGDEQAESLRQPLRICQQSNFQNCFEKAMDKTRNMLCYVGRKSGLCFEIKQILPPGLNERELQKLGG